MSQPKCCLLLSWATKLQMQWTKYTLQHVLRLKVRSDSPRPDYWIHSLRARRDVKFYWEDCNSRKSVSCKCLPTACCRHWQVCKWTTAIWYARVIWLVKSMHDKPDMQPKVHSVSRAFTHNQQITLDFSIITKKSATYRGQVSWSWNLLTAQQKSDQTDHVFLHKRLQTKPVIWKYMKVWRMHGCFAWCGGKSF